MKLYFSIDLESWAYPDLPSFRILDSNTRKKIDNGFFLESTNRILDLLARYDRKVTFFAIAEIWEWYPDIFRKVREAGHEIGYHTHRHIKITDSDVMRKELMASRDFIKEFKPRGFRAPEIYLPLEAIQPLINVGFSYSSSTYGNKVAIKDKFYEFPVSTFLYRHGNGTELTFPRPMSLGMLKSEIPFGSGYFLALLPLPIINRMIEKHFSSGKSIFMFTHSWQVVVPKNSSFPSVKYKILHPSYLPYVVSVKRKVEYLLKSYTIGKMEELVWDQKTTGIRR